MNRIVLLDYEPRTAARVTEALARLECEIVSTKNVDAAVAACANVEPRIVLIASVLPQIKVEDAITQLRARAGLRNTPFLVMMSGYTGHDPHADALRLGAQDIVAKPFSNDELLAHVEALIARPQQDVTVTADTRAEILEMMRRGTGDDVGTVTSEELFGDLLVDESVPNPAETQRIAVPPPAPPKPAANVAAPASAADEAVARTLDGTLADLGLSTPKAAKPRKEHTDVSVDKLLEATLSGLEVNVRRGPAAPPAPVPSTPASEDAQPGPATAPGPGEVKLEARIAATSARAAATPVASLPGGTPFGQYELIEPIATGGMAEVYRARMRGVEGFQKIVAIKRILPHLTDNDEFVTMFIDEAKLAAQLQHPNIIHIYDLGKIERSYYIAMEYIDGKDLRSILRMLEEKHTHLPVGLALFIGSRLAAALDYAHRKKDLQGKAMALVHRDVSPQNVLISFDGDIKLCDFGIAKAASKASHTRAGALKGKLQYMSPEQAWGKDIDHRSDIFSLGLVLYEMLTGRKGFAGDSELSILEQVRAPKLVPPREIDPAIPPEVERVVMKALKEDCEQRYQTAAEFASALGNILQVIRPAPGAFELGSFLTDLVGRERQVSAVTAPAARPAIVPPPPVEPAKPAPAPRIPLMEAALEKTPEELTRPSGVRLAPIAAVAAGIIVIVAAVMFVSRSKPPTPGAPTQATPAPETVQMAREAVQQEVAKQTQAMRGGIAAEAPTPPATAPTAPSVQRVAAPVATQPVAALTQQPRQVPTVRTPAPTTVPARPSPAPTEAATPAPAVVQPTEQPATPVPATPTAAPTHAPLMAAQPAVKQGDLVEMGNGVIPPEPIYSPKPAYPPLAERQRISGTVLLTVLVDNNGSVQDVKVLRPITPDLGLTAAAVAAARTWRYKPATKDGVRVKVWITQAITFRL
jgi:TonB family protein